MLLTHRLVENDVLLVRLLPVLSIRSRAAATLALEELTAAYAPRHLVLEIPGIPTPAAVSVILRATRSCGLQGRVLTVVALAAATRLLLRDNLPADGPAVHATTEEALNALRRTGGQPEPEPAPGG
ncbi:hypothetical protein [Streptomyces sp. cmx-4-9]|uniref:hypothetical protein n=1 Tax=Streptomyces sp. cmx-4-9 TaxID=2790941 RepID=UPI00397EDD21